MRRYAAKIDANQPDIVAALRAIGCSVDVIGEPVDLLVGYRGRSGTLEVKDGSRPPSERKLTPQQIKFQDEQRGFFRVVESVEQAIAAVQEMTR